MKGDRIATGKGANQCSQLVRIAPVECRVGHERPHALDTIHLRAGRLYRQPLIDHQRLVLPPLIEVRQHCLSTFKLFVVGDPAHRCKAVRQIVRTLKKAVRGIEVRRIRRQQIILSKVPQRAQTNIIGVR